MLRFEDTFPRTKVEVPPHITGHQRWMYIRENEKEPPIYPFFIKVGSQVVDKNGAIWELRYINLEDLNIVWPEGRPDKPRPTEDDEKIAQRYAEWARSIILPPPLHVHEKEDGILEVYNGHHRARAAWLVGMRLVEAWVRLHRPSDLIG